MVAHCGNQVVSLKRLAMGSLTLDETLAEGEYRLLTDEELAQLRESGKGKHHDRLYRLYESQRRDRERWRHAMA